MVYQLFRQKHCWVPHGHAERRALHVQGRRESGVFPAEIDVKPAFRLIEHRERPLLANGREYFGEMPLTIEPKPGQGSAVSRKRDAAQRGFVTSLWKDVCLIRKN